VNMNAATFQNLAASLFIVNPLLGPIFNPETPASNPNNVGWFDIGNGIPYSCLATLPCNDPSFTIDGGSEILRTYIALDSSLSSSLVNETKSIAKMQLYDELKTNPGAYPGNAILMQFKNKNDTSSIGKLYQVKNKLKSVAVFDSLSITLINQNDSILKQKISDVRVLDSLSAANPSGNNSLQRKNLINEINILQLTKKNLITARDSVARINVTIAKAINNEVAAALLPEQNQKAVNDLVMKYYLYGTDSILLNYAQIISIAAQCPYSGGPAVYQARSLAVMINDTLDFNDAAICSQTGIFKESNGEKITDDKKVQIIPNPANDLIEIIIGHELKANCVIKVFDVLGNEAISLQFDCKLKSHNISVRNLRQGIYFVSVMTDDCEIAHRKIVVVK